MSFGHNPPPRSLRKRPWVPQFVIPLVFMSTCVAKVPFRSRSNAQLGRQGVLPEPSGCSPGPLRYPFQAVGMVNSVNQFVIPLVFMSTCVAKAPINTAWNAQLGRQGADPITCGWPTWSPRCFFGRGFGPCRYFSNAYHAFGVTRRLRASATNRPTSCSIAAIFARMHARTSRRPHATPHKTRSRCIRC